MPSILIAALLTFVQGSPAISKDAADLKELHRLEAVWNDAHVKGDADALDKLWANDLIVTVAGMPTMNKADSLSMGDVTGYAVPANLSVSYGTSLSFYIFARYRGRAGAHGH